MLDTNICLNVRNDVKVDMDVKVWMLKPEFGHSALMSTLNMNVKVWMLNYEYELSKF